MYLDIAVDLKEGMKIARIDSQEESYTLIKSNEDNEMYGVLGKEVIKLKDIGENALDSEWICTDLNCLEDMIQCVEYKNSLGESTISSFDTFCIHEFAKKVLEEDFKDIEMREFSISREDYKILKGNTYEIKLRDKIKQFYEGTIPK